MDAPLSSILRPGPAAPTNDESNGGSQRDPVASGDGTPPRSVEDQLVARLIEHRGMPAGGQQPVQHQQPLQSQPVQSQQPVQAQQPLRLPDQGPLGIYPESQPQARSQQDYRSVAQPLQGRDALAAAAGVQPAVQRSDVAQAASSVSSYPPAQRVEPVRQRVEPVVARPAVQQPASQGDDMLAAFEGAALNDIGAALHKAPPVSDDVTPLAGTQPQEPRRKKLDRANGDRPGSTDGAEDAATADARPSREERRAARQLRQQEKGKGKGAGLPAPAAARAVDPEKRARKREKAEKAAKTSAPREWGIPWTAMSFFAMVLIPAGIAAFYYFVVASPQYQVETQFAVRGSSQGGLATMGLPSILGGTSVQTSDSYIVTSYVESLQLIRDVQQELGVDLRQFYARDNIDWMYRIDPEMPLEKFTEYWRDMTEVSFNATTGNTTLYVYAFSAEDSKAIADAVLKVSERLVNQLSESNRQQVMQVASKQVDRAEERLRKVQVEIRRLRIEEGITDPVAASATQNTLLNELRRNLSSLKTRYSTLMMSVAADAPQAKSMQKQIDSLEAQIRTQEAQLGPVDQPGKELSDAQKANLAEVLNKFEELTVEQQFATQAYTTALAAFETAIVEAQRQERYFATFVAPTQPEIALYPMRYLDSFIAFLVLLAGWMVTQFIYRSFRDHAI